MYYPRGYGDYRYYSQNNDSNGEGGNPVVGIIILSLAGLGFLLGCINVYLECAGRAPMCEDKAPMPERSDSCCAKMCCIDRPPPPGLIYILTIHSKPYIFSSKYWSWLPRSKSDSIHSFARRSKPTSTSTFLLRLTSSWTNIVTILTCILTL